MTSTSSLSAKETKLWPRRFLRLLIRPDTVTGDIVFVLQYKEHPKFKRKGEDLFYEHTLSLTEALCVFRFVLTRLDGRQLLIKSNPGEVVRPGLRPSDGFKLGNRFDISMTEYDF